MDELTAALAAWESATMQSLSPKISEEAAGALWAAMLNLRGIVASAPIATTTLTVSPEE